MSKLKKISGKECVKILCNEIRGSVGTVVPNHPELKIGTLKSVLNLA